MAKMNLVQTRLDEKTRSIHLETNKLIAPGVGIQDEPTRCYKINKQWAALVMGMVSLLADIKMWQGANDDDHPAIIEILKFLQGDTCMDCNDVINCVESGDDYNAFSQALFQQYKDATISHIAALDSLYDDVTPQSVFPAIITTAASADSTDDNNLCYALFKYFDLYAANKSAEITINSGIAGGIWQGIKDAAIAVWNKLKNTAGSIWNALVGGQTESQALANLDDDTQRDDLVCCLHSELRTAPLTETTWLAALAACSTTNDLAALAASDLANTDSFLYFLDVYNEIITRSAGGEIFYCPCDTWCLEWTLSPLGSEWTSVQTIPSTFDGIRWENGQQYDPTFSQWNAVCHLVLPLGASYTIKHISYTYDLIKAATVLPAAYAPRISHGAAQYELAYISWNDSVDGNNQVIAWNGTVLTDQVNVTCRASKQNSNPATGYAAIRRITIRGTGTPPALGDPC